MVHSESVQSEAGAKGLAVDVADFPSGLYTVRLTTDETTFAGQLSVVN